MSSAVNKCYFIIIGTKKSKTKLDKSTITTQERKNYLKTIEYYSKKANLKLSTVACVVSFPNQPQENLIP